MNRKTTFIFYPTEIQVQAQSPSTRTLLDLAMEHGIVLEHVCGGMASCGTCRVKIHAEAELWPQRNDLESDFAQQRGLADHERLACQVELDRFSEYKVVHLDIPEVRGFAQKRDWNKSK